MCGFAGYLNYVADLDQAELTLEKMGDAIAHRGPDDSGVWVDCEASIGLSHRRLAIVDLSLMGHQPMVSASGRYVFVFNGEIYNHQSLRKLLEMTGSAPHWQGSSDTETLLAGFDVWGVQASIEKSIGMFAFAVWDRATRTLMLGRDRVGEKPLYYGCQGDTFLFCSELKSLQAHPTFKAEIDRNSLTLLMRHSYIPSPYSIYKGIFKLQPGCILTISLPQLEPRISPYWSGKRIIETCQNQPFTGSTCEAVDGLEYLLMKAVGQQMMADVPLGAFLSGGVDSSTVVALMQSQSPRPVHTFSIGFHDNRWNEAHHAKAVAQHLGTDHTEFYVTAQDALNVIPRLASLYDEPFADPSQIPTCLVSAMARQQVTVSLSGDGGDELFCGYGVYVRTLCLWKLYSRFPLSVRRRLATVISAVSPRVWYVFSNILFFLRLSAADNVNWGDKLQKGGNLFASSSGTELYRNLISLWSDPTGLVIGASEPDTLFTDITRQPTLNNLIELLMSLDMLSYLPDDILTKLDRAAMGVSLETRLPFLDRRVVEYAWRLPLSFKLHDGIDKWVLRQVLYKYVPKKLIERPKQGFGLPLDFWLRGPLKDWAEGLLSEKRLKHEGFFEPGVIRLKWQQHLSGQHNWQYQLWSVLMFQAWLTRKGA